MMFGFSGRLPCELSAVDSLPCELSAVDSLPCELSAAVTGAKEERSVKSERRKDVVSFIMNVFVCGLDSEVLGIAYHCLGASAVKSIDAGAPPAEAGKRPVNRPTIYLLPAGS